MLRVSKKLGIVKKKAELVGGGYLCVVALDSLHFDDYQRDAIGAHVKNIVGKFSAAACLPLQVNKRDGRLMCYDGAQRTSALLCKGHTQWDAIVYDGKTYEEEARLFFHLNDIPRQMNGWKKFFADIKAGNHAKQMMIDVIHKHRLTVPKDPGVRRQNDADVTSSRAVMEAVAKGGTPLLEQMCKVLDKSWRNGGPKESVLDGAKKIDMLRGLINYLHTHKLDNATLKTLKLLGPDGIREIANTMTTKTRPDAAAIAAAISSAASVKMSVAA